LTGSGSNILMGGARNLKLEGNVKARARAQGKGGNIFLCGPNVDLIQLFCASKRRSGVQGSMMPYLLWLRSSVARLPPRATVLASTY